MMKFLWIVVLAFPALSFAQTATVVSSCSTATYTAGKPAALTVDTAGNLCSNTSGGGATSDVSLVPPGATSGFGITPIHSTAAEASHVLKASPGNLYSLTVTNGATAGYVLILNATSDPGNGAVTGANLLECWAMPGTNSTLAAAFNYPDVFSTGITAVFSSTGCFTETQSATAYFSGQIQ